jgi:predicted Zn-dependent protease
MLSATRVLTLFAVLTLPELAQRTILKPDFNIFTTAQDAEFGRIAAAEIEAQSAILQNVAVVGYLNALGTNLAAKAAGGNQFHFQLRLINDRRINAFGLPGGIIYVNRGTIEAAENEAQLASVIGHEIGHVVLRHGSHLLSKAYALQSPVFRLGVIGKTSISEALAQVGGSFTASSLVLKNPLEDEEQADLLAVQILFDGGYDPEASVRFFEILQSQTVAPQRPQEHPETAKRIARVANEIRRLGAAQPNAIVDSPEFQTSKALLLNLP